MNIDRKSLQVGTVVVICAVILRLFSGDLADRLTAFFTRPDVTAAMIFVETGRVVRTPQPQAPAAPQSVQPDPPEDPIPQVQAPLRFTKEDAGLVSVNNASGLSFDTGALLEQPLSWDLTGDEPTVLILHTHTSESYSGSCDGDTYRTQDESNNMLAVGSLLAQKLEDAGIRVIHDRSVHDYPSYNGSYNSARKQINAYLKQYPSIRLVLDIHRDAMEDSQGNQIATSLTVNDEPTAKIMMVVGTNAGGLTHPNWKENMSLAMKLHVQMEKRYPGICRPISFRSQRFNQDLSPGAMLIEIGAAGNTKQQALNAAALLCQGIIDLAQGANK